MKRLHRIYPLAGADEQTDISILGGWWLKETAGSTARVKILLSALDDPSAPVAALAGAGAGNVEDGTHSWKVTFVTAAGETEPSAKSNVLTVVDKTTNGKVTVTIPVGPSGTTARKVYRTVTGDGGDHKLVATVANNSATTYEDNTADGSLGASAPTTNTTGTTLFDIPMTANQFVTGPNLDMPADCGGEVFVESVSGAWTGSLIGQ